MGADGRTIVVNASYEPSAELPLGDIVTIDPDGEGERLLTHGCHGDTYPAWSADGQTLVFLRRRQLYAARADGSRPRLLARNAAEKGAAAPSPDGAQVAYAAGFGNDSSIFVVGRDDKGCRRLTAGPADLAPAWTRDGRFVVFTREGRWYAVDPAGGRAHRLATRSPYVPTLSPDGRRFVSDLRLPRVREGVWSPDGRRLVVARDDDGDVEADTVYVVNADGTGLDRLTQGYDGGPLQAAWRPLRR